MKGVRIRCDRQTTAEVRFDTVRAERFSALARSPDWFDRLLGTRRAIFRCPRRPGEPPHNRDNPGNVG